MKTLSLFLFYSAGLFGVIAGSALTFLVSTIYQAETGLCFLPGYFVAFLLSSIAALACASLSEATGEI